MTLADAIEAELQTTLFTSSLGDPREVVDFGPIRVIRDAPGRKRDPRRETMLISGVDPDTALDAVRAYGPRHWALSVIEPAGKDHELLKRQYKEKGYRRITSFPFFARDLASRIEAPEQWKIDRVTQTSQADALAKAAGRKKISADYLHDGPSPHRVYAALVDGKALGWVMSIYAIPIANWVSDLYVLEPYRRKHIGEALMRQMLLDDQMYGVKNSVLLASNAGSNLYRRLGYEELGLMQIFTPVRAK